MPPELTTAEKIEAENPPSLIDSIRESYPGCLWELCGITGKIMTLPMILAVAVLKGLLVGFEESLSCTLKALRT